MESEEKSVFETSTASAVSNNETLESFAVAQKMTVKNVKNMIYHILTDTSLFANLVGCDKQAIPHIRLTRSRWREIQQKVNVEEPLEISLNPVAKTRTFLDVDYGNNDDDDPEYDPTNEDVEDDYFQFDMEGEDLLPSNYNYTTESMDPEYLQFIDSCIRDDCNIDLDIFDDEGDEEYNVMTDEQMLSRKRNQDAYEYRQDKSTEISSREITALWDDFDIDVNLRRTHASNREAPVAEPVVLDIHREDSHGIYDRPLRLSPEELNTLNQQFEQHMQLLFQCIVGCSEKPKLESVRSTAVDMFNELTSTNRPHPILLNSDDLDNCHNAVCDVFENVSRINEHPEYTSTVRVPTNKKGRSTEPLSMRSRWIYANSTFLHYPELVPSVEFAHFDDAYNSFLTHERALLSFGLFVFQKVPLASARQPMGRYQWIQQYMMPIRNPNQIRVHIKHTREKMKNNPDMLTKFLVAAFDGNWTLPAKTFFVNFKRHSGSPLYWPRYEKPDWLSELSNYLCFYRHDTNVFSSFLVKDNQLMKPTVENAKDATFYLKQPCDRISCMPLISVIMTPKNVVGKSNFSSVDKNAVVPETVCTKTEPPQDEVESVAAVVDDVDNHAVSSPPCSEVISEPIETLEVPSDAAEGMSRSSFMSDRHTESMDEYSRDADTRSSDVPEPIEITANVDDSANDFEPLSEDERSRNLQRRHVDVLKALTDPENRHNAFEGLVSAVQNDINRRFFMHADKLKKFRAIVGQSSKTPAEILCELKIVLDDVDQEIVFVLASLLHDDELIPLIRDDPRFYRIKKALDMIMDVQTYVYGTRGLKTLKHIAKSFRNELLNDVDELKAILKNLFRRDPKVCMLFLPDESCETDNSRYEEVNVSNVKRKGNESSQIVYETIEIPYKRSCIQSQRAQPQLYHGHIIHEHCGNEMLCDIHYQSKYKWTDACDLDLLKQVLMHGTDHQSAAKSFCAMPKYTQVTLADAMDRLVYLRSLNN